MTATLQSSARQTASISAADSVYAYDYGLFGEIRCEIGPRTFLFR